jgi:uncharacterized secreted protein with C-terminal beta-propeller domain
MRIWLRVGTFVVVTGTLVAVAVSAGREKAPAPVGGGVRLVAYSGCADMLSQLRRHAAAHADQLGYVPMAAAGGVAVPERSAAAAAAPAPAAPQHSTTTVHEAGVDEPDVVKTDGRRVVTVSRGVLRVVDTSTRQIIGSVPLPGGNVSAWSPANLLISGDRALVIGPAFDGGGMRPMPSWPADRLVLVDLAAPKVLGTMTISGSYVDARMVGSMVRLVARSQPSIEPRSFASGAMRAAVERAPLSAWLPSYRITEDGTTFERTVDCARVSHPRDYTGTSMLTIYSIDLPGRLGDIQPISLAADGDTVYGTTSSLYVASNPYWFYAVAIAVPATMGGAVAPDPEAPPGQQLPPQQTEIHRFDITGSGPPRYVASGSVPGRLLNQYALSDYNGYLRVATTSGQAATESAVYELRAETLTRVGSVGGLGKGQRIYAVRFIGPVGYVVTFRQVDPLYTLDLRDPTRPRVVGQLELTGYSSYLAPATDGQLIGVGQEATNEGRTVGLQVALFDVSDPAHPRRLAQLVKTDFHSAAEFDPHAFLYWPATGTAVLPVNSWTNGGYTQSALVLTISTSGIAVAGTISQPGGSDQVGITRAMVIGDELWTLSDSALMVSDLGSLTMRAWIGL